MLNRRSFVAVCAAGLAFGNAFAEERVPVRTASLSTPVVKPTVSKPGITDSELTGSAALQHQIQTLESMIAKLHEISDYTAEMTKQERIGGDLSSEQRIQLKFRHSDDQAGVSTSIYMKWLTGDRGREAIFVEGENNGKLLVHAGGWKARILPVLALDPTGSLAMGESRHPITEAGLLMLTEKWLDTRKADLARKHVVYNIETTEFDGRPTRKFTVLYGDRTESELYRKCELWIDAEHEIPIAAVNYTWDGRANDDDQTLIERYEYRDVKINTGLSDVDFDKTNRKYSFKN